MTKAEMVEKILEKVDHLTKKQVEMIITILFDSIKDALIEDGKMEIRGFGSFRLKERKSRSGRNPKSGEIVEIPSKKVPFFKVGKEMRKLVNN